MNSRTGTAIREEIAALDAITASLEAACTRLRKPKYVTQMTRDELIQFAAEYWDAVNDIDATDGAWGWADIRNAYGLSDDDFDAVVEARRS